MILSGEGDDCEEEAANDWSPPFFVPNFPVEIYHDYQRTRLDREQS